MMMLIRTSFCICWKEWILGRNGKSGCGWFPSQFWLMACLIVLIEALEALVKKIPFPLFSLFWWRHFLGLFSFYLFIYFWAVDSVLLKGFGVNGLCNVISYLFMQ